MTIYLCRITLHFVQYVHLVGATHEHLKQIIQLRI